MKRRSWLIAAFALVAASSISRGNNFPWGWCTYWAEQEFNAVAPVPKTNWSGDAGQWVRNADAAGWVTKTDPKSVETNCIIVWTQAGGGWGHVAWVTKVTGSGFTIREMNVGPQQPGAPPGVTTGFGVVSSRSFTFNSALANQGLNRQVNLIFAGYVMPRRKTGFMTLAQIDALALTDMRRATAANPRFTSGSWLGPYYSVADANYLLGHPPAGSRDSLHLLHRWPDWSANPVGPVATLMAASESLAVVEGSQAHPHTTIINQRHTMKTTCFLLACSIIGVSFAAAIEPATNPQPTDGSSLANGSNARLRWLAVNSAASYRVAYGRNLSDPSSLDNLLDFPFAASANPIFYLPPQIDPGLWSWRVDAFAGPNGTGDKSTGPVWTFRVADTQAPVITTGLITGVRAGVGQTVGIPFHVTDNGSVVWVGYEVATGNGSEQDAWSLDSNNALQVQGGSVSGSLDFSVQSPGIYYTRLVARDADGNEARQREASFFITVINEDATPPDAFFHFPADGQQVSDPNLQVGGGGRDETLMGRVELQIDDGPWVVKATGNGRDKVLSFSMVHLLAGAGDHYFRIRAYDDLNNVSEVQQVRISFRPPTFAGFLVIRGLPADTDPFGDLDADGVPNALEYIFATDLVSSTPSPVTAQLAPGDGHLILQFTRFGIRSDYHLTVEALVGSAPWSAVATWAAATGFQIAAPELIASISETGGDIKTIQVHFKPGTQRRILARVRAGLAP